MVAFRKKKVKPDPPEQDIPKDIVKGVNVLYMLQRISYHHCILVSVVATENNREYEQYMLKHFGTKIKMRKSLPCPGWFGRMHVKFGISKNLPKRLEDINDDIFGTGTTEWRAVSWLEYILALHQYWKYRNKVVLNLIKSIAIVLIAVWIYIKMKL
jgi:hypothetical protein